LLYPYRLRGDRGFDSSSALRHIATCSVGRGLGSNRTWAPLHCARNERGIHTTRRRLRRFAQMVIDRQIGHFISLCKGALARKNATR